MQQLIIFRWKIQLIRTATSVVFFFITCSIFIVLHWEKILLTDRCDRLFSDDRWDGIVTDRFDWIVIDRFDRLVTDRFDRLVTDRFERIVSDRFDRLVTDRFDRIFTERWNCHLQWLFYTVLQLLQILNKMIDLRLYHIQERFFFAEQC